MLNPDDAGISRRSCHGSNVFELELLDGYDEAGSSGFPAFRWAQIATE